MRIKDIRVRTVPISRYADPAIPSGGLTTTIAAVVVEVRRGADPVVGFGFASIGRFGQTGLISERFAPRLLAASPDQITNARGDNLDPFRAWQQMMQAEKPGGHGERCVAVGTLDMALWDAAAKIAGQPLHAFVNDVTGTRARREAVPVYASGGYDYPTDEHRSLSDEIRRYLDLGYTHVKIKIGGRPLAEDLTRIEQALTLLPGAGHLAVDAMNRYAADTSIAAARRLAPYGLRWFEDMCDPLDFDTHAQVADQYPQPMAVGEALFSAADARNLIRYAQLRPERDVLVFDPVHTYGLPGYLEVLRLFDANAWPRTAHHPHGGHLFALHLATALGLGGCEANPHNFQPIGGLPDGAAVDNGHVTPPDAPGIGIETRPSLDKLLRSLLTD